MSSPLFSARFEGECEDCGEDFDEGDLIGYSLEGMLSCGECWHRYNDTDLDIEAEGGDDEDGFRVFTTSSWDCQ